MADKNKARTLVRQAMSTLKVEDGDVILVKRGSIMSQKDNFNYLSKYLGATGRQHCLLVSVDSFDGDLVVADEAKMRDMGWQRIVRGPVACVYCEKQIKKEERVNLPGKFDMFAHRACQEKYG